MDENAPDFGDSNLAEIREMSLDEALEWSARQKRREMAIKAAKLEAKPVIDAKIAADWKRRKAESIGQTAHVAPEPATLTAGGDQ